MTDALASGSDIRIDAEGMWFYRGIEMIRHDIISIFYRNLAQDASGCYFIEIGQQRYRVDVEDTAYAVWSLKWTDGRDGAEEYACLYLSDGSMEKLNPETLRIGGNHIPYCRVKDQRFEARFSRAGYYKLAERLQFDSESDAYFIALNGRRYLLPNECL